VQRRHPPCLPPCPYTTLFRSRSVCQNAASEIRARGGVVRKSSSHPDMQRRAPSIMAPVSRRFIVIPPSEADVGADRNRTRLRIRSEEHTSALLSRANLVFRLL